MTMSTVFAWLFLILGSLITLVSYWLFFQALYGGVVERASRQYAGHGIRATLIGLVISVPLLLIGIGFLSAPAPIAKILGGIVLIVLLSLALLGSAGLTRLIGERLPAPTDELQPWRRVFRGGTVLSITFVLPFVGWFLVLPLTLLSGVGAALLSLRTPKATAAAGGAQA